MATITGYTKDQTDTLLDGKADTVSLSSTYVGYDIPATVSALPNANAAFIAAATAVAATGRTTLRVAPGTYTVPGITPDDILGLYLVGDGVRLVGSPYPNLYPFTTAEWIERGKNRAAEGSASGVIGFELDDAMPQQWEHIFPVTKELGIVIGVSWPTNNGALWIKEAWRHGWEIMAHGHNHETFATIPIGDVETICQQSVAAISAITGSTDNIALVYPEHSRNAETDRVCSKYFIRGRGQASNMLLPRDQPSPWMTSAFFLDPGVSDGVITTAVRDALDAVARTNGRLVFYMHAGYAGWENTALAIRGIVARARELGIRIDLPSKVYGSRQVTPDAYFERETGYWPNPSGAFSWSTDRAYKGTRSLKFTPGGGSTSGTFAWPTHRPIAGRSGRFTVCRASVRYWADADVTVSSAYGLSFLTSASTVGYDGIQAFDTRRELGGYFPDSGTKIPAAQWARISRYFILGPDIVTFSPALEITVAGGQQPFYFDELKIDALASLSELHYTATLNGTTGVKINTGLYAPARYGITITPRAAVAGNLYCTTSNDVITIFSTDAADVGMDVGVTISAAPTLPALPNTGA